VCAAGEKILNLPDGVPCKHPGCLSHISHPCEGCGRIGGRTKNSRDKILELFPESKEMPDFSGAPSADYCIVRPATKEDWPENKWVSIGPYVRGNPWDAAWKKIVMDREGITEQDIAESTPKWPWES